MKLDSKTWRLTVPLPSHYILSKETLIKFGGWRSQSIACRIKWRTGEGRIRIAMKQLTLGAANSFEKHNRPTRKAAFLARMDGLIPWRDFCALIEPHYPKRGNGRPPVGLERMLRMFFPTGSTLLTRRVRMRCTTFLHFVSSAA
tara:strand:+ start:258 stop:689 length:432 start_codon:yes stop_codon:yes gene_type:complete